MAQLGWLIDLDKCTGCDSCTVACKAENNTRPLGSPLPFKNGRGVIPDHVSYRWVVKKETGVYPNPTLTFVTSACNHCEDPACLVACPTKAIFKRAEDGIVLIDQDKCIGCKYCIHACPYGAPQFNSETEKVEKCTFCVHRLYDDSGSRTGFEPACVTTCVGNALHMVEGFNFADSGMNAPDGFADPSLTQPAVNFRTG
ncbi:MAG: 4Fe-4S dicluster domain-containing protein [Gammaproteobacteria bacterium]|nr:4Fe-4S dicluster domain-containing protein [Gammaproteobacteria bacterium]MDH3468621.1 4Fe-4S dicluster domain-containing protein [Gammaproteobacteria bacterium]